MANKTNPLQPIPGRWPARRFVYWLAHTLRWLLVRRSQILGRENIPATGPVIVVINHITAFDPVMVWMFVPRIVVPLVKVEAYSLPVLGWLMRIGGSIPVQRGEADTSAIKSALRVLRAGECILLAPEGTRSRTGQLQPAKDGATMLALRSDALILPVGVTGTEHFESCWRRLKRGQVTITFGPPFKLAAPPGEHRLAREEMAELTTQMMRQIAQLLPPEYRGVYGE